MIYKDNKLLLIRNTGSLGNKQTQLSNLETMNCNDKWLQHNENSNVNWQKNNMRMKQS
jgi:hypothetical protein